MFHQLASMRIGMHLSQFSGRQIADVHFGNGLPGGVQAEQ